MFAKLIPYLCHITNKDERFEVQTPTNAGTSNPFLLTFCYLSVLDVSLHLFSEIALSQILQLLKKEVSDHSRHLHQYFQVFLAYAHKGAFEVSYHCNTPLLNCFI